MDDLHHHDHDEKSTPATIRFALAVLVPAAIATILAMLLLWPGERPEASGDQGNKEVNGTVVGISEQKCPDTPETPDGPQGPKPERCGKASVELDDGGIVVTGLPTTPGSPSVDVDDRVVLMYLPEAENSYQIIDQERSTQLWILVAAFALAVVAFGRVRGLLALVGLAVTFAVLLLFIVPAILSGESPLLVAIVGASAIMLSVLYLTHGFRASTTIAVLGTMASLILTGLLSALAVYMAGLTGIADEQTNLLSMYHGVNTQGLLLAGILIGSLGALDDVTVTQASAVRELARANPDYTVTELYSSAARIGRSHIASVVNTLVLAYAGAALPLMILIAANEKPLGEVLTTQLIAEEIVRSAVGTIGLVAAVPLTTLLAAVTVRRLGSRESEPLAEAAGPRPQAPRDEWLARHDSEDVLPREAEDSRHEDSANDIAPRESEASVNDTPPHESEHKET